MSAQKLSSVTRLPQAANFRIIPQSHDVLRVSLPYNCHLIAWTTAPRPSFGRMQITRVLSFAGSQHQPAMGAYHEDQDFLCCRCAARGVGVLCRRASATDAGNRHGLGQREQLDCRRRSRLQLAAGAWVYGLAADIYGTHLNSQANTVVTNVVPAFANVSSDIDWYGTVRGRLGWSSGPLLFYGTGGLAYGGLNLSSSLSAPGVPIALSAQTSSTRAGWVAGGGIEYMWRPNVLIGLEYQYVDLGTLNLAAAANGPAGSTASLGASEHGRFSAFTVGMSWLFTPTGAPVRVPSYGAWEGGFVGGKVGGAWGNDTNATYSFFPGFPSDARLKRDIVLVGRLDDGLGLYRYRYLWSDTVYVGVMAQEVALLHPESLTQK